MPKLHPETILNNAIVAAIRNYSEAMEINIFTENTDIAYKILQYFEGKATFVRISGDHIFEPATPRTEHEIAQRALLIIENGTQKGNAVPDANTIDRIADLAERAGLIYAREGHGQRIADIADDPF